jgi:hypothetical protein
MDITFKSGEVMKEDEVHGFDCCGDGVEYGMIIGNGLSRNQVLIVEGANMDEYSVHDAAKIEIIYGG